MSIFKIRVAGIIIEIHSIYTRILNMCNDFLTEEEAAFSVSIDRDDIRKERFCYQTSHNTNTPPDDILEVNAVLRKIAKELIDYKIFLMHGAVISLNNEAFLFTAPSGTGKSMHLFRWLSNVPEIVVVNGDKPFIVTGEQIMVCGSPWAGKENLYTNIIVPLKAIVLMERSDNNKIEPVSFYDAFPVLLQQTFRPKESDKIKKTLQLLKDLENKVAFYHFLFDNFRNDSFHVAYSTLCGSKETEHNSF